MQVRRSMNASAFSSFEAGMEVGDMAHDDCPNCRQRFEILLVKFALAGVRMVTACPNCAMVPVEDRNGMRWSASKWWARQLSR
jgi:hypothetical protein